MPVACAGVSSVLTGSDGAILFTPPGTEACLGDAADFPAGIQITLPAQHDFRVGDVVTFAVEGSCNP